MNEFDVYDKYFDIKNKVVYDIGAHIGQMSLYFINKGAKEVIAFEPSLNNWLLLKSNVMGIDNIKTYQYALGEKNYSCFTQFKDCRTDYIDNNGQKQDTEQEIHYVILEDFIKENNLSLPNMMKIDIEGSESYVLNTFSYIFKIYRPSIYLEVHVQQKEFKNQNYENNRHWIYPSDGGFNFNKLKDFNYSVRLLDEKLLNLEEDWNPKPGTHSAYILTPN